MNNWQAFRKILSYKAKLTFSTLFSGWGWGGYSGASGFSAGWPFFSGSKIDYSRELGDLRLSSMVMAGVGWVQRGLNSARLQVVRVGSDRKEQEVQNHALIDLWMNPNEWYDESTLLSGLGMSWLTAASSYLIKVRSGNGDLMSTSGKVQQLWWEPHWSIEPRWPQDGSQFISYYEIWRNGRWLKIHPDNVIPLLDGIDMDRRRGQSRMSCLLRELYVDQQSSGLMAQLLRNGLVPPMVVSLGDSGTPFTGDTKQIKNELVRKMTSDTAGEPLVISGRARAERLGLDYSSFGFKDIRKMPQEQFCAAMGISPISLNWTGETRDTFDNVRQYLARDYKNYIVTLQTRIARAMRMHLLPEFGRSEGLELRWDYSQTPEMQPDKKTDSEIATQQFTTNGITRAEYREAIGYAADESRDNVFFNEITAPTPAPFELPDSIPPEVQKFIKALPPKKEIDAGAEWWRTNPAIPDEAKDLIDAEVESVKPNGKIHA